MKTVREVFWVGMELDPERPDPQDFNRHGIITRMFSHLEEQGYAMQTVQFDDGASLNRLEYEGETLFQAFRIGDSMRIGFGWEVTDIAEGVQKIDQVKQMLKAMDLNPQFVSVFAWTPPTPRPAQLVSVAATPV